jgi:spore germination cell wall hydrolase CwlJ-like protein
MDELTPAQKHYEAVKRANKNYYRRNHPNPRPRGRPRKVVAEGVVAEAVPESVAEGVVQICLNKIVV